MNYYNDNNPKIVAWLKELRHDGLIGDGEVDGKDIRTVSGKFLREYDRVHLFAGIGGWEYALQLAGWPDTVPVWTGSPPCQPFSVAGKRRGTDDHRHLWPEMYRLISECGPPIVFGEQVASKSGRAWLSGVRTDMEALGYVVGAADLCAASIGAPHIRQRIFWGAVRMEHTDFYGCRKGKDEILPTEDLIKSQPRSSFGGAPDCWLGHTISERPPGLASCAHSQPHEISDIYDRWASSQYVSCTDGKKRRIPTEPFLFPLAHGIPNRMGVLRGAGNAIVPQLAALFVRSFIEAYRMVAQWPPNEVI